MKVLGIIVGVPLLLFLALMIAALPEAQKTARAQTYGSPLIDNHGATIKVRRWLDKYGLSVLDDVTLTNPNADEALRDFTIECTYYGNSGTAIRSELRTLYERVGPKSSKFIDYVDLGFMPRQKATVGCRVLSAVSTYVPPPKADAANVVKKAKAAKASRDKAH